MPEIHNNYFYIRVILFALMNCGGAIILFMGFFFATERCKKASRAKTMRIYLSAVVWIMGYSGMLVLHEPGAVRLSGAVGFAGSVLWLFCISDYMTEHVFATKRSRWERQLYVLLGILLLFSAAACYVTDSVQFVLTPLGAACEFRKKGFSMLQFMCVLGMIVLNARLFVNQKNAMLLKREKNMIYIIVWSFSVLIACVVFDYIWALLGYKVFPVSGIAAFIVMTALYCVGCKSKKMSISVDAASNEIYESVPMPVLILDMEHRIQTANRFAGQYFECADEEMLGRRVEDYLVNSFFSLEDRFKEEVRNKRQDYEVSVTARKKKSVCNIRYNIVYDSYGECLYAVLIVNDMSRQYEMFHKLEESRNRAEIANAAKSEFLANMSHEIRTPLNVILGMDQMILRECKEPELLEYADNIKNAADSMVNMVNDILDMSKMEGGRLEIVNVDYQLRELVAQTLESMREKLKNRDIELQCEVAPDTPDCLWGDETRLNQIIHKFLSNAEKYTKSGKIILRIWGGITGSETVNLHVEVEDTGIGIREEDIGKLFHTFNRVDLKKTRTVAGLGLGLSIVKRVVEAMDGEVSVRSEYGKGSVFSFVVPQHMRSQDCVGDFNEWYNSLMALESGKVARCIVAPDARILAVDDTNVNLEVVRALLKRTRIQVDVAHSGAECLEKVTKKQYHVILMDHMMPEMDGIETLHRLKTMEGNASAGAPVIALTANAVTGAREFYLESGFTDYMKKPVKSLNLEQMLIKYLPKELVQVHTVNNSTVSADEWASMVQFEHINVRTGLMYTDNNHEMLQSIMKQFMLSGGRNIEQLNRSMMDKDWKNYGISIHAVKSTALNIGAEKLSTHAKMLEAAVQKERYEYIHVNHVRMIKLYQEILDELKEYFDEADFVENTDDTHESMLPEVKKELLKELLGRLGENLEMSITTEIEKLASQLKSYSFQGVALKEKYRELFNYIDEYEYDKAYEMIEEDIKKDVHE